MICSKWLRFGAISLGGIVSLGNAVANDLPSWEAAYTTGVVKIAKATSRPTRFLAPPSRPTENLASAKPQSPASTAPNRQRETEIVAMAESLIVTCQAAVEAGTGAFASMTSLDQIVAALAKGVQGGGKFSSAVFRVPGLDAERQREVVQRLTISGGRLLLVPPPPLPEQTSGESSSTRADPLNLFANGRLKVAIPPRFEAEKVDGGDLLLRAEGALLRLHLEKRRDGFDAWGAVRLTADHIGKGVSMSGTKVYLIAPDRRRPEKVTIGFGESLVTIQIEAEPGSKGNRMVRFALPGIIESLAAAE